LRRLNVSRRRARINPPGIDGIGFRSRNSRAAPRRNVENKTTPRDRSGVLRIHPPSRALIPRHLTVLGDCGNSGAT
jgi:hypothetical protein